jgi:predicted RNA-binding protein with EMAP domain|tara:strand:+ start:175 stop:486 length:312 start_codon:yes stop_codon:yes gene_type:complete
MEITEKKIVNVLTNIMTRLDDLEFAQHQHKEMFYTVKKRLLELNDNLNDILDVIEGADMQMIDDVKSKYSDLRNLVDNELDRDETDFDDEDARELMNQIVGES